MPPSAHGAAASSRLRLVDYKRNKLATNGREVELDPCIAPLHHVAPIARELGLENVIATEPEMKDGRYTGRVAGTSNMREGKVTRLEVWLGERAMALDDFRESWFYSDSVNDLPLLSRVTHPVAVNADPPLARLARERGWPQIQIK